MGASWLPEPPIGHRSSNGINTVPVPSAFFPDSDNDDQGIVAANDITENGGYRLLNDQDNQSDEGIEDDDSEDDSNSQPSSVTLSSESSVPIENSDTSSGVNLEVSESVNSISRDITVDYDQVRAAMAGITLPQTAIPSWASAVPDSEWWSFLQDRIRTLQGYDTGHSQTSSRQDNDMQDDLNYWKMKRNCHVEVCEREMRKLSMIGTQQWTVIT